MPSSGAIGLEIRCIVRIRRPCESAGVETRYHVWCCYDSIERRGFLRPSRGDERSLAHRGWALHEGP
jgi:hypothetical protein